MSIATGGIDLAKNVFTVHGVKDRNSNGLSWSIADAWSGRQSPISGRQALRLTENPRELHLKHGILAASRLAATGSEGSLRKP